MGEIRLALPVLHPGQQQLVAEAGRFNVPCMGRRWGKSLFVLDRLIETPGLGILDGRPTGWFAATNKIADEVWRLGCETLEPIQARRDSQHRRIECITGGSLEVWSLESAGAGLGRRYGVIAVDEAAIVPHLATRWRRELRPTLTDFGGVAWFPSTPRGRAGDYYDLWNMGREDGDPDWRSWQMPTATNPHIDPAEIESARREYERAGAEALFRQEYLAEFVSDVGMVFRPGAVRHGRMPKLDRLFMGIDPALTAAGLGRGDETAFAIIGLDTTTGADRWWLVHVHHGRWDAAQVVDEVFRLWEAYPEVQVTWLEGGPAGKGIEPWLRRQMDDRRTWRSLEMVSHLQDKVAKASAAAALVNSGDLWVPEGAAWWPYVRDQLAAFDGQGLVPDDVVDGFGIAVRCARSVTPNTAHQPPAPAITIDRGAKAHRDAILRRAKEQSGKRSGGPAPLFKR